MRWARAVLGTLMAGVVAWQAGPAGACGGLVAPNGAVRLVRTTTLAAWHAGYEHYVTSFQFDGDGAEFGSIVPLPGIPTKVEKGGSWTLQRLEREVQPPVATAAASSGVGEAGSATVILQTHVDALELTVLKGGGGAVGQWAKANGFLLTPDAPELLDYYARHSLIFLAARFDAAQARARGQQFGDGTPVHLTIPLPKPWVPLRILTLGQRPSDPVSADVFVLTDLRPTIHLPEVGARVARSQPASSQLLGDLRADQGMQWVPDRMWLTYVAIDAPALQINADLVVAGPPRPPARSARPTPRPPTTLAPTTTSTAPTTAPPTTAGPVLDAAPLLAGPAHRTTEPSGGAVLVALLLLALCGGGVARTLRR
ncbi:MAG TPA: DUF2330 domain-containing protein [Acidimicrobiales bacterium]